MTAGRQRDLDRLQDTLGVRIDPVLLELALTHRSFAFEAGGVPTNERLEFLGDSVLGLAVLRHQLRAVKRLLERQRLAFAGVFGLCGLLGTQKIGGGRGQPVFGARCTGAHIRKKL